ncbi:hypothetical protein CVT24_010903 [Panaeolus cyanescens]|uniref:C2H2-type domain-containing protein n=1 Tax=Panaeolus cyanescens TaxID=181874 RepID=A0A409WDZ1_9AGAR|nr:hypothetical protein CVT24_010903 [Panaeolus cyanescens]
MPPIRDFTCPDPNCNQSFKRSSNLRQHYNSQHRPLTPDSEPDPALEFETDGCAPVLTFCRLALPCDADGNFISQYSSPQQDIGPDAQRNNPWHPFSSRLSFDWAYFNFVELQASEQKINKGLDLWLAAKIESGDTNPALWSSAQEMYATIDAIQEGNAPFHTISFRYNGPLPSKTPPRWMTQTYELCMRDAKHLLQNQLNTAEFRDEINLRPYRQFNHKGERVWSNLMSGDWAWEIADALAQDACTHGAMLVPVVAGSDKTTVSVATGHQEFHPVYLSPGNFTNTARRSHTNSVLPVAFLPIPKTNKRQAKRPEFQRFVRQVYHMCLSLVFSPLKETAHHPDIVRCPDGHFRRAIYIIGPYIADYPEQVWLAGIVQGWCPKCDAHPNNLDDPTAHLRSHERTDFMINSFDPGILWEKHGIRDDVVPFTHSFPLADIHATLTPDLLHQLIKGTFKDHLVEWVNQYLHITHGETHALAIIADIDQRISAVPLYSGLRRFSEGRNFEQWTGDDSKALMKVYISAIAGHVPSKMVQCFSVFMELCYIFRRNAISSSVLTQAERLLKQFHALREVFIDFGVRTSISLPRQHALMHYLTSIPLFGSPNGLCSSITESKHIKAVKEPWRRSSRFNALPQMLRTIVRLEKLEALKKRFYQKGMLVGSTAGYTASQVLKSESPDTIFDDTQDSRVPLFQPFDGVTKFQDDDNEHGQGIQEAQEADQHNVWDVAEDSGPRALSSISLSARRGEYPRHLDALAKYIAEPELPRALLEFIYTRRHPKRAIPDDLNARIAFTGKISVFHSAVARFYAPSDLCGAGGMYRQKIRSNPSWFGHQRRDTVFVVQDDDKPDDETQETVPCALVSWFVPASPRFDRDTRMHVIMPEGTRRRHPVQRQKADKQIDGLLMLPAVSSLNTMTSSPAVHMLCTLCPGNSPESDIVCIDMLEASRMDELDAYDHYMAQYLKALRFSTEEDVNNHIPVTISSEIPLHRYLKGTYILCNLKLVLCINSFFPSNASNG